MNRFCVILAVICIVFGCNKKPTDDDIVSQRSAVATFDGPVPAETAVENKEKIVSQELKDANGPTVFLFNETGGYPDNTLADFMYFVPLISPVPVSAFTSQNNTQGGNLLSYESDDGGSFYVACEFRMKGKGFYLNEFDDDAMVEWNTKSAPNKKELKNILDYIKFEGEGYGRIEARGEITGSKMSVENVKVSFDARDSESPVIVGLYDVDITKKIDGHYKQYNKQVARITTLTFNRSEAVPRMELKVSAVGKDEESLGTLAHIKGFLGNLFIEPIEIDKLGNNTMLEFGLSLYKKDATFTFPKAKNLKVQNEPRIKLARPLAATKIRNTNSEIRNNIK